MTALIPLTLPRPFDPEAGARAVVPGATPDQAALIAGAAGCAPFLAAGIAKEAAWLADALQDLSLAEAEIARVRGLSPNALSAGLRQVKRRVGLICALADLGGVWPLETVTETLTRLADAACDAALRAALHALAARGKLPGLDPEDLADCAGMTVLAMGKMGAGELNYSSDIDLICLFDEARWDPADFPEARAALIRATRTMCTTLSDRAAEGYVFRTDLRLRPNPSVTPVCVGMEAAERYYEAQGRTWERAAFIKARACAGDLAGGQAFLETLRPFVWRRHLDFAAIEDAHDMRLAIRAHKGTGGPITLPGHDMKLGRGGIREIEFFTQTRQLIAGGRDPGLRPRGTVAALNVLAQKGWVDPALSAALQDHYRAHRTIEHRVQMVRDAQTHSLPTGPDGFDRLAAMMGTDTAALKRDLTERLEAVHRGTEGFFAPAAPSPVPEIDDDITAAWPSYPALRSPRGAAVFERIRPALMEGLSRAAAPAEALHALDGFLRGLPTGVQLFSLFEANPHLGQLLIDIVATSPSLARYLSGNAAVFDAVIGGDFFGPWPGAAALEAELAARLQAEADYEARLDAARFWQREWHFRIGVHHLRGLISCDDAALQYADLARTCLRALWPVIQDAFAARHGAPPGRGAVILGMGSVGAGRMGAGSDLDLILIYDAAGAEMSEGPRPLASRPYYARLTQALITALSAPMAQGRLYEVDLRLRPSGNAGPVATSIAAFEAYQREDAWLWEHMALSRGTALAGPNDLMRDVEAIRARILALPRDIERMRTELREMRARIAAAKGPAGPWEAKVGRGRLQEIELIAQAGTLLAGAATREVGPGLEAAAAAGLLRAAEDCARAYGLCFSLQMATRLVTAGPLEPEALGAAGRAFVARACGAPDLDTLAGHLSEACERAGVAIDDALDEAP
ncbi:MAG: glutamine-synthetase adenylyltransferase [Pseudomonadota bacterium]